MLRHSLARLGAALALVLVVATFALLTGEPSHYLSPLNLRIVVSQTVIVAIGAIGMTMIIVSGGIDLSVGSVIALTGVVAALGLSAGWPPAAAIVAAVATGGLVGLTNGALITGFRVVPFIATLGMLGIARGVAKWLANEQTVNVPATWVNDLLVTFPRQKWLVVPVGVWIALVLALVAIGTELDVIAAVVIGGGSLHGGEGSIFGSMVGALIMAFLRNGCQQMGWPNYIQDIIIGSIIVLAVALDRLRLSWST